MAKKKVKQTPEYRRKTAVVQCKTVFTGETFTAIWKTRRLFKTYPRQVVIRIAKIACPAGVNTKYLNKQVVDLELLQLQELQKLEHGAAESTVFLRQIEGRDILIEYAQYPNGEIVKDQEGRILAMVFMRSFGGRKKNIGLELVRQGYARLSKPRNNNDPHYWTTETYDRKFGEAYKDAEYHRRGPLHKNKPKPKAKRLSISRQKFIVYCVLFFAFGFLLGLLTWGILLNMGILMLPALLFLV